jgi:hypothetical protein
MSTTSDTSKWREYLKDNKNFNQDVPFNFKDIYSKLQVASENPEKLNPFYTLSAIYDFTKIFYQISSALSMGFSDITKKAEQMRKKFDVYPESNDIQELLGKEIQLGIYQLNGNNNSSLGHGDDQYYNYVSACRTFLRLLWFLEYLIDIFESILKDDGSTSAKKILGNSYDKVLGPRHSFLVRNAVSLALTFSSTGNVEEIVKLFFGVPKFDDEARKIIQDTLDLMKKIWKGGNDYYEKQKMLDLK